MDRAEAVRTRARLIADPEFYKKLMAGDAAAQDQLDQVSKALVGPPEGFMERGRGSGQLTDAELKITGRELLP